MSKAYWIHSSSDCSFASEILRRPRYKLSLGKWGTHGGGALAVPFTSFESYMIDCLKWERWLGQMITEIRWSVCEITEIKLSDRPWGLNHWWRESHFELNRVVIHEREFTPSFSWDQPAWNDQRLVLSQISGRRRRKSSRWLIFLIVHLGSTLFRLMINFESKPQNLSWFSMYSKWRGLKKRL